MQTMRSESTQSKQMPWTFDTWGAPGAPALVLLHGWLGRGADWLPLLRQWQPPYFCLLPDLPGHGGHAIPQDAAPYRFESIADALVSTLESTYGLSRWHLGGYSMGGRLALRLALRHPQHVRTLLLESCQPGLSDPQAREQRAALDRQRAHTIRQNGLTDFVERWHQAPLFRSLHANPILLAARIQAKSRNNPEAVARILEELSPGRQAHLWDSLHTIACPTLLLSGAQDPKYTQLMARMHTIIPHSQLASIPYAGHDIHTETPTPWLQHVQTFLSTHT